MQRTKFNGIIPPVSSIFDAEGKLEKTQMKMVIDFLIDAKVDGLFFLGTGGEFSQMTADERMELAEFAVRYVDGRLPVLIGTGSTGTKETVIFSEHAQQIGADGIVIINPYYWDLSERNLFYHYETIATSVDLPIILYNFPALTGQDLSPRFVESLVSKHENIVGIKDTVDSIGHIQEMIDRMKKIRPDFSVFAGFDHHLLNTLQLGGDGSITASVNFAPQLSVEIYRAFLEGNFETAIALQKQLSFLPNLYSIDRPFVNVVKEAMKFCGLDISTSVLPPSTPLTEEQRKKVKKILIEARLLGDENIS